MPNFQISFAVSPMAVKSADRRLNEFPTGSAAPQDLGWRAVLVREKQTKGGLWSLKKRRGATRRDQRFKIKVGSRSRPQTSIYQS